MRISIRVALTRVGTRVAIAISDATPAHPAV